MLSAAIKYKKYIFLLLPFILLMMSAVNPYAVSAEGGIEIINIEGGFDGIHKIGTWTPVTITLKNSGDHFDGEVQVVGNHMEADAKSSIYALPINLPSGGKKQFAISVPVNRNRASIDIRIVQGKAIVKEQKYYFKKSLHPNTLLVGVLTDDMSGLRYLAGLNLTNEHASSQSEVVELSEKSFPVEDKVLQNFNVLVINNFDTSMLDNEQRQRLVHWVENGGLLMLGTGANYKKVLNGLPEPFKIANQLEERSLNSGTAFEVYTERGGFPETPSMRAAAFVIADAQILLADDTYPDIPLIASKRFGKGSIAYLAFDMGLEPFSSWEGGNRLVCKNIITTLIGERMEDEEFVKFRGYEHSYHSMYSALRNMPSAKTTSSTLLMILMGLFILIVGPVNYLILKKKDKREWSWVSIPVIVLVFSLGIYIIGFGTRVSNAVGNIVSIIEFKNDSKSVSVTAHTGLFNARRGTLKITTSKDVGVDFTANLYSDRHYRNYDEREKQEIISKFTLGEQPAVEFYDKGLWDFSHFIMHKKVDFPERFGNSITVKDNIMNGHITNNTVFKLEDAFIIIGNSFVKIGDLEIAETKEFSEKLMVNSNMNNYHVLLDDIFEFDRNQRTAEGDEPWRIIQQRRSIFEYYYNSDAVRSGDSMPPVLYGWSDADLELNVYANGKPIKKYHQNLIVIPMTLNLEKGEGIQLPYGFVKGKVESAEGNVRSNFDPSRKSRVEFDGEGRVIFQFNIPRKISVSMFTLNWYTPITKLSMDTKRLLYNYHNEQWEEITSYCMVGRDIAAQYISKDNKIKVMFDADGSQNSKNRGNHGMIEAPDIELEGVVR